MRLIDADELKIYIDDCQCCYKCPKKGSNCSDTCTLPSCLTEDWKRIIDEQATIDPVKHGSWLMKKPTYTERYVCSECFATGKYHVWSGVDGLNYCPHCGAKMDKEENE